MNNTIIESKWIQNHNRSKVPLEPDEHSQAKSNPLHYLNQSDEYDAFCLEIDGGHSYE